MRMNRRDLLEMRRRYCFGRGRISGASSPYRRLRGSEGAAGSERPQRAQCGCVGGCVALRPCGYPILCYGKGLAIDRMERENALRGEVGGSSCS